jgi:peptidyl-prolyl cis-trans isomerase C
MKIIYPLAALFSVMVALSASAEKYVIEDGGVGMTYAELEYVVRHWSPEMQEAAGKDLGDRLELLNLALSSKKIAAEADKLTPKKDGDLYWQAEMMRRTVMKNFIVDQYLRKAELPDMRALAKERYLTDKDKYAAVPETRISSHILVLCQADQGCNRDEAMAKAQALLAQLDGGADFEDLARQQSDDKATGENGGRFERWLGRKDQNVAAAYVKTLFSIKTEGQYKGPVNSQFGYHIIRLDEIKAPHYKPYEEVESSIVTDLVAEYTQLNAQAFDARFRISDEAYIDGKAMEKLFSDYGVSPKAEPAK